MLITRGPIDVAGLIRGLDDPRAGAICVFEGRVRDHHGGRPVRALAYDCYPAMAEREIARLLKTAQERWSLRAASACHRIGNVPIGEAAVWVGVSADHRDAGFAAVRYLIDEIKARVPIWKHETYGSGELRWSDGVLPTEAG